MKIYKNLVNAVATILHGVFREERYADKSLEYTFKKNPQWGSRDRRFVAEAVYDITRNFRFYSFLAETDTNFWFITSVWLVLKKYELPDWPEFKHVDPRGIERRQSEAKNNKPVLYSYPDWLWQTGTAELGTEKWEKEAIAMNETAPVYLRTNTLKIQRNALAEQLRLDKIETEEVQQNSVGLILKKRDNIFSTRQFKEGLFEIQDLGSQAISGFLSPENASLVIDACAGAGGKTLHLAALMRNKGRIISLDVEEWKLEELKKRARRAGAHNVETKLINPELIRELHGKADRLLLDVPCSGIGVLKRNPDAKWKLSPEVLERTRELQRSILSDYSSMLAPRGVLVYSTCSILPSENEEIVREFLNMDAGFRLVEERHLFPSQGTDGFYMAKLIRA